MPRDACGRSRIADCVIHLTSVRPLHRCGVRLRSERCQCAVIVFNAEQCSEYESGRLCVGLIAMSAATSPGTRILVSDSLSLEIRATHRGRLGMMGMNMRDVSVVVGDANDSP